MNRFDWPAAMKLGAPLVIIGAIGALAPAVASAEIYGWVDPSGDVTYSNLPPPKNARVFDIIKEDPPASPQAQAAAEAAHRRQMDALNDRVRQLESEIQLQRQVAAAPSYAPPGPYSSGYGPSYSAGPSYGAACDPEYYDCSVWDGPAYWSVGIAPWWPYGFRRDRDRDGFRHHDHDFRRSPGAPHFGARPPFAAARPVASAPHGGGGRGGHAAAGVSGPMAHGR
jgi:hypothetical protein